MTVLSMPSPQNFIQSMFTLVSGNTMFESPTSGYIQVRNNNNEHWEASFTVRPTKHDEEISNDWKAFLVKLNGRYGRFYGFDPDRRTSRGTTAGSTPLVKGSSQTGYSLLIDGCANSTTVFKAGDYIEFGGEYKMVTDDVVSDGSGNATINFMPAIRKSPNDNSAIVFTNPMCLMMLNQDSVTWESDNRRIISVSFTAREAFDYTQYLLTEDSNYITTEAGDRIIL